MRKRKLLFTLFMTMLMMMLCPQRMWADWTYDATAGTITDGTNTINNITCSSTELTIGRNSDKTFGDLDFSLPVKDSDGNTYTITVISNSAFYNCTFNSLKLPNELTTIGVSAFAFHTVNNGSITIPASVTSIGKSAFGGSRNLDSFVVESGNANYCVYDDMLYDMNKETLMACPYSKTGSVELPNTVKTIQEDAFYNSKITSITLPESLTTIGGYAFLHSSITSVNIPKTVTSIGTDVFLECYSLSAINVEEGNTSYCSVDGILYSYDKKTLIACPAGNPSTSVKIPDGVVTVQRNAFAYNTSLKSVEIPSSVTNIGSSTFWCASSLATITCNATTPPTLGDDVFVYIASGAKVIVPDTSADAYKAASNWSSMNIVVIHDIDSDGKCTICGTSVTLSFAKSSIMLAKDEENTLTLTTDAKSSQLTWTSSDENIVTVDATGKVTAKALGTADITVTFTGTSISATCHVTVATIVYMPTSGSQDIALAAGESLILCDDGGANSNYSNDCDGTINLTAPEGYLVKITGTCAAEGDGYDELLINGKQYDYDDSIDQTTDSNCSIRFYSDDSDNYAGFALTATAVPFLGNIAYTTEKQIDGTYKIDFTFVNKDEFAEYTVNEGTDKAGTINNGATTLQLTRVSQGIHTYTFTDGATSVDVVCMLGVYLIPQTGTKEVELTAGETINIYDDGGADNNYSNYCDGTINLTAPEGYLVKITGTCVAEGYDCDELLINGTQYDYGGWDDNDCRTAVAIDQTTSNNCSIRFYSDESSNYTGFALTATAIPFLTDIKGTSEKQSDGTYNVNFTFGNPDKTKTYTVSVDDEDPLTNKITNGATTYTVTGIEDAGDHTFTFADADGNSKTVTVHVATIVKSWTATAVGDYSHNLYWGRDIILKDYTCQMDLYEDNTLIVNGWDGVEGDNLNIALDDEDEINTVNGITYGYIPMNHSEYTYYYYYNDGYIGYTGLGADNGYINICGYYYNENWETGSIQLAWGSYIPVYPTVTLNKAGYATYSCDYDVVVKTDGVKAYTGTLSTNAAGDDIIVLTECDGYIPAGTGVVLYGDGLTNTTTVEFTAPEYAADATDDNQLDNNVMKATTMDDGSLDDVPSGVVWALGPTNNQLMKFTGTEFTANRAYYLGDINSAKGCMFVFADDEATGVEEIENGKLEIENSAAYNALGQRIRQNAKGLVIKNGQKFFNK